MGIIFNQFLNFNACPTESFICLQNNILVMLSVLNFIPDHRSSKCGLVCGLYVDCRVFKSLRATILHVLTKS